MMRHELIWREKFVRNGKLWGDLGSVCKRARKIGWHDHNSKFENSKLQKKKKRKKRARK
jgi:hypothetical protein